MRAAIFSLLPVRDGSTVASVRIARWLSEFLGLSLYDSHLIEGAGVLDVLFIVNGSTLYCKCLPQLAEAVRAAQRVVWVQNDYTLPPPKAVSGAASPFRRAFADRSLTPDYWTTCEENSNATPGSTYINWNALGYAPGQATQQESSSFLYYGAWRTGRAATLMRVGALLQSARVPFTVSSTSKHAVQVPGSLFVPPVRVARVGYYAWGVYAQDVKTAPRKHSPATRFYEMLSACLPMCFTEDCVPTLAGYGIDVRNYVLDSPKDATRLQNTRNMAQACQQKAWGRDYVGELKSSVTKAWEKLQ